MRLAPLVLPGCILLLAVHAHAAPRSACVAPIQQVSASTKKEVDAAVSAKLVEVGKAAIGGASSSTVSNDTVLLSQNQLAANLYLYQLCKQAEAGMIPPEEFAAERRFVLGMGDAPPAAAPVTPAATADPPAPAGLVGSWVLKVVETRSTCAADMDIPGVITYLWKVGVDADAGVSVEASGASTSFPELHGRVEGDAVRVAGTIDHNQVVYFLRWTGDTLAGDRIATLHTDPVDCTAEFSVGGTRQ